MVPFVGEYRHVVDHKGRIIIPAKLRQNLDESIYLCKGFETCLLILTANEIQKIEEKIKYDSLTNISKRKFARAFFSSMTEITFDNQGRILIPNNLKEYSMIKSEVVIVGNGFYIEIWDKSIWDGNMIEMDLDRTKLVMSLEGCINGT